MLFIQPKFNLNLFLKQTQYSQPTQTMEGAIKLYEKYLKEELNGKSDLHLKQGDINKIKFIDKLLTIYLIFFISCGHAQENKNASSNNVKTAKIVGFWGTDIDADTLIKIKNYDNIVINLNNTQLVIMAKIKKMSKPNSYQVYWTNPVFLGKMMPLRPEFVKLYSKDSSIAELNEISAEDKLNFKWKGFYNNIEKTRQTYPNITDEKLQLGNNITLSRLEYHPSLYEYFDKDLTYFNPKDKDKITFHKDYTISINGTKRKEFSYKMIDVKIVLTYKGKKINTLWYDRKFACDCLIDDRGITYHYIN